MSVFDKIKKLLDINHISIAQLSKMSSVPVSTIYSLKKRGSKRINLDTLKKIADALGVNINYFAGVGQSGSVVLTQEEEDLILKVRSLDEYALKVVKSVVNIEFERVDKNPLVKLKITVDGKSEDKEVAVNIDELADALKEAE